MAGPLKDTRKRKYQEEFINESFKVNKLIRHLRIKHDSLADRGTEFFKRKAEIVKKTRIDSSGSCQQEMILLLKLHI
jgi:hypothetical protein